MSKPKVVTIGGGSGSYVVLSGLKKYDLSISAVVTMMDSGGSTGRLRDQLGVLPPGDLRQALVALSESDEIWRSLFTYRFDNGDLTGHNFGNIFLSALEKLTGSNDLAISHAAKLLQSKGQIIPVTSTKCVLCAKYADGSLLEGEALIDDALEPRSRILYLYATPEAVPNPVAIKTVESADYIIFGPGDIYTSIFPNLLVSGMVEAINKSRAKKVFIVNLMTKLGQTDRFTAVDLIKEMERYAGVSMDYILINNKKPKRELVEWYKKSSDVDMIKDNIEQKDYPETKIIRMDLLSEAKYEQSIADRIKRSLIRHDASKLGEILYKIVKKS